MPAVEVRIIVLSLVGIFLSSVQAIRGLPDREVAVGCDTFGYLRSARAIRSHEPFDIDHEQARILVRALKEKGIPSHEWQHAVAPYAHRYIERANKVSLQYPPGTGLVLSLFPEGRAVFTWTLLSILVLLLSSTVFLLSLIRRGEVEPKSVACTILAAVALVVLERIGHRSYSINALVLPLLAATFLAARKLPLAAGLAIGFCTVVRIPVVLIAPGLAWLSCRTRRDWFTFSLGFLASGVIPLALYNQVYGGAAWATPYGGGDTELPTFRALGNTVPYYLGLGPGSKLNWTLVLAALGTWHFADRRTKQSFLLILAPTWAFFLTHSMAIPYYTTPSILAAVAILSFATLLYPAPRMTRGQRIRGRIALGIVLLLWPIQSLSPPTPRAALLGGPVPQALLDPKTWVWSDELSGTFHYHLGKPSFKPHVATARVTEAIFSIPAQRRERQFLVQEVLITPEFVRKINSGAFGPFAAIPFGAAFGSPVFELVHSAAKP